MSSPMTTDLDQPGPDELVTQPTPVVLTLRVPTLGRYVKLAEALGDATSYATRRADDCEPRERDLRAAWLDVAGTLRAGATEALAPTDPSDALFARVRAALDRVLPTDGDRIARSSQLDRLTRAAIAATGPRE
ncbi:hypothetical protein [Micromonospora sp. NPDC049645]|uniref:hypothetical protein n=1 Tax=Micromonospora sp. NPDC049645 TaxID=3155508 RepID=UPI00341EC97A